MKKAIIMGLIQASFVYILTKFVEGIESEKFPLLELIFNSKSINLVSENKTKILLLLIAINILVYLYTTWDKYSSNKKNIYDNICESIFNVTIDNNNGYKNSDFRVSLFKIKKGLIYGKDDNGKYYLRFTKILVNVGRHQTRSEKKLSKIKFLPGEGVVGSCYEIGEIYFFRTSSKSRNLKYKDELYKKTNLPYHKICQMQQNSASYVGMPVKFHNSSEYFGVVIVDSLDNEFQFEDFRKIEDLVNFCSIFFKRNEP